jgi:hypothetical protein
MQHCQKERDLGRAAKSDDRLFSATINAHAGTEAPEGQFTGGMRNSAIQKARGAEILKNILETLDYVDSLDEDPD